MIYAVLVQSFLMLAVTTSAFKQQPMLSPEIHSDRSVTFRFRDLGATKVDVGIEGRDAIPMTKGQNGIWSVQTPPLAPDLYGYTFSSDGETRLDIHNPQMKPNLIWQSNMFLLPGTPSEAWEVQHVPHGQIHHEFYQSKVIGDERDFFVYTPPGYRPNTGTKYPVLYLLHGYSDVASGWTEVGKAHVIMDNLIAQGKTKPMLVVMTLGYGVPDFASPNRSGFRDPNIVSKNYELYKQALMSEVIPSIEKSYRVKSDRRSRAIAGLSMGGAESLYVGLNNLATFSSIGAFSSGGLSSAFDEVFPNIDAIKKGSLLKLLWISCGTEDGLIGTNRNLVTWLKQKQVPVDAHETSGRHTWMVWRRNLIDFSQLLFKD